MSAYARMPSGSISDALVDHLVDQVGMLVAEVRAHAVEVGVHQRLQEGVALGCLHEPQSSRCALSRLAKSGLTRLPHAQKWAQSDPG